MAEVGHDHVICWLSDILHVLQWSNIYHRLYILISGCSESRSISSKVKLIPIVYIWFWGNWDPAPCCVPYFDAISNTSKYSLKTPQLAWFRLAAFLVDIENYYIMWEQYRRPGWFYDDKVDIIWEVVSNLHLRTHTTYLLSFALDI